MATSKTKQEDLELDDFLEIDTALLEKEKEATEAKNSKKPDKRKTSYVFIRHNSSDNYKDPKKAAEHGVDLYPGGFSRDMYLSAILKGNKLRYLTGLDEELYKDSADKTFLQESLAKLIKDFSEEVLDPFNAEFWKNRKLAIQEDETILDLNNSDDLLTYWNIKGGGFPYVAKSPDELAVTNARFYLEEPHLEYELNDDGGKLKDKAIAALADIDDGANSFTNLFILHKMLIDVNEGVTYNTPRSLIYTAIRRFIDGDYYSSKKKKAPKDFLEAVNLLRTNNKKSRIIAFVNDAIFYGHLIINKSGTWSNFLTGFDFRTQDKDKLIDMLCSPTHQEEIKDIANGIQKKWNKY